MTLDHLATPDDLAALGIDTSDSGLIDALLASASSAVREAAGCPITTTTGTITLDGGPSRFVKLPGWAIREVDTVLWDGDPFTDYRLRDGRLFCTSGWGCESDPPELTVTYTQGVDECPADIVNLVCSLVAAGIAASGDGYNPHRGVSSERIDDYQRSFTRGVDEVIAPMDLPQATIDRLARRFGNAVHVTGESK